MPLLHSAHHQAAPRPLAIGSCTTSAHPPRRLLQHRRPVGQTLGRPQRQQRCRAAASDAMAMPPERAAAPAAAAAAGPICDAGNSMSIEEVVSWLRQHLPFRVLSKDSVRLIAELVEVEFVPPGKTLAREGTVPSQLVIVRSGTVKVTGATLPQAVDAGPGAAFFLVELLLNQATTSTVRTTSDATLWVVRGEALLRLAADRPDLVLELGLKMSQNMAGKVVELEAMQQSEERRSRALQPYLVTTPKRGIIGNSKYADRLRRQIVSAAKDPSRRPCLVFGEPGLQKDNVAALLHFGSPNRAKPLVQVDCLTMDPFMTELFGRGSREGLLHWLRDGALVINNAHKVAPFMLPQLKQLLETGTFQPAPAPVAMSTHGSWTDMPQTERQAQCRVILTAEQTVPELASLCTIIKVPPLRVRPADIIDFTRYLSKVISKEQGRRLTLTPEAERALLAYPFPDNVNELEGLVRRAAVQVSAEQEAGSSSSSATKQAAAAAASSSSSAFALDKDVFWFARQSKDRFRWNMLNPLPALRKFLLSDLFPQQLNDKVVKPVFAAVVLLLFVAPQDRDHNFCLSLFWNYWWPLMFVAYPFLGRIWCSFCPFMVYGEVMQRWRTAQGVVLRKWPREELEVWGGWFLFGLFAAILVWEEVWDLPQTAYLSSWLLLIITGGAVVCSAFFERRLWCRYLCPIGGMNGLFAKLSMTELRARQGVCSGTCSTYHCYKGGPSEGEGQETGGCPVYSHPAQLTDNRNCVLCMTCLKACPHRSIEFRLRLPGVDLWTTHKPTWYEVALMFMLLGAVPLHSLAELEAQLGISAALLQDKLPHMAASVGIMAVPGIIAWGSDALMRGAYNSGLFEAAAAASAATAAQGAGSSSNSNGAGSLALAVSSGRGDASGGGGAATASLAPARPLVPFLALSYGYLPLVWGGTLAHYLRPLLEEAGHILPVTAATFGANGEGLPVLEANHAVTLFLQGATLLLGSGLSLLLTRKIGAKPWVVLAPQCLTILGLTAELWFLNVR